MKPVDFRIAFAFPFNRAKGMLNILWALLPIFGWLALIGYQVRITQGFVKGRFKELPKLSFKSDMKLGFWMLLKAIPFILAIVVLFILTGMLGRTLGPAIQLFICLFVVLILAINFFKKQTVDSFFELGILKHVFDHFTDYLVTILKAIGLAAVFLVMWIVLVGIPAGTFTKNLFVADFYRRRIR